MYLKYLPIKSFKQVDFLHLQAWLGCCFNLAEHIRKSSLASARSGLDPSGTSPWWSSGLKSSSNLMFGEREQEQAQEVAVCIEQHVYQSIQNEQEVLKRNMHDQIWNRSKPKMNKIVPD